MARCVSALELGTHGETRAPAAEAGADGKQSYCLAKTPFGIANTTRYFIAHIFIPLSPIKEKKMTATNWLFESCGESTCTLFRSCAGLTFRCSAPCPFCDLHFLWFCRFVAYYFVLCCFDGAVWTLWCFVVCCFVMVVWVYTDVLGQCVHYLWIQVLAHSICRHLVAYESWIYVFMYPGILYSSMNT